MADKKISALTASTTPLAGTEVLPIVQSGATVKVSVANLTAGRNVSGLAYTGFSPDGTKQLVITPGDAGHQILGDYSTGSNVPIQIGIYTIPAMLKFETTGDVTVKNNLVMGTSGKGIDFSATSGTGTSELFADYEEGTWTPTLVGTTTNPTVTYSLQRGIYTKVGRIVTVSVYMGWSALSGGSGNIAFGGLPFTIESTVGTSFAGSIALFDGFTLSAARTSVGLLGAGGTTYSLPSCFGSAVSSQYITVGSVAAGLVEYTLTYSV
jgi:hypothetical protein